VLKRVVVWSLDLLGSVMISQNTYESLIYHEKWNLMHKIVNGQNAYLSYKKLTGLDY
jgi:hypothetical protein